MTSRRPPITPIALRRASRLALGLTAVWMCGCPTAPPLREVDPDVVSADAAPSPDVVALDRGPDVAPPDAAPPDDVSSDVSSDGSVPDDMADGSIPDDMADGSVSDVVADGSTPDVVADATDVAAVDARTDVAFDAADATADVVDAPPVDRVAPMDVVTCPVAMCDGRCVNTATDGAHCGGCGNVCLAPRACTSGRCAAVCGPGLTACSTSCVDTATDVANCGSCGRACAFPHGGAACITGMCRLPGCLAGWADCDGVPENGCERPIVDDVNNCGGCNMVCNLRSAVSVCRGISCAVSSCLPQYRDCNGVPADGCETNSLTDRANCGACGVACPTSPHSTPACELGVCGRTCDAGYGDCNGVASDGCETSLFSVDHCGACDTSCTRYPHTEPACGIECEWRCEDCWLNNDGVIDNGCERQIC